MMYALFYLVQFEGCFGYVVTLEMIVCKFIMCICKTSFRDSTATSPFIAAHPSKCCFTYEVQGEGGLEVYEAVFLYIKHISKRCLLYSIHIHVCSLYFYIITGKVIMANKGRN